VCVCVCVCVCVRVVCQCVHLMHGLDMRAHSVLLGQ
jgi:hypothetical protein